MATLALIPDQIEAIFQQLTMNAIGTEDPAAVRISWQTEGQPAETIDENVIYVRCVEQDDQYDRIRDLKNLPNDEISVTQEVRYTRVWRTFWVAYGPIGFDNIRKVRSSLLNTPGTQYLLANASIYLITDTPSPQRIKEYFVGQWWDRTDFNASFNEEVVEVQTVPTVDSVEIIGETSDGQVFDITIKGD